MKDRDMFNGMIFTSLVLALIIGMILGYEVGKNNTAWAVKEVEYYKNTYKYQIGSSQEFGSYHLVSLDAGKNWYSYERSDEEMKILGPAEEIHPGLLAHIQSWDKILDYVEDNGPISLTGENAAQELELIKKVGFEVNNLKPE